jgi:ornithine cyclodeaminase/alanine dehydrogenase-like protein (mu-crystallin family)
VGRVIIVDRDEVRRRLDYRTCIGLMHDAMIALWRGHSRQLLRSILDLGSGNAFGVMPGALDNAGFGAKLISVFPGAERSHQGLIILFDERSGAPLAVIDAGEVTAIRTACASAVATDALARPDAGTLVILGTGEQAWQHALAIPHVREVSEIRVWGRSSDRSRDLAVRIAAELGIPARACSTVVEAASGADIICTTTAASEPILSSDAVADGTHINLVGSSRVGPVEIDGALLARARFVPDHREGVLAQGAEFLKARAAGLVAEAHVLPEIGAVLADDAAGRLRRSDVTIYKSLGSIVQDLACARFLAGCAAPIA